MLLGNLSTPLWLIPGLSLMLTILYLCKYKAHRINPELCGNIVINNFRQLWSVIILTGTQICTVQYSSKRVELLEIPFQQLNNLSLVVTISLQNTQLDALAQSHFLESVQQRNSTETNQPSQRMARSNLVDAYRVNLSMRRSSNEASSTSFI